MKISNPHIDQIWTSEFQTDKKNSIENEKLYSKIFISNNILWKV